MSEADGAAAPTAEAAAAAAPAVAAEAAAAAPAPSEAADAAAAPAAAAAAVTAPVEMAEKPAEKPADADGTATAMEVETETAPSSAVAEALESSSSSSSSSSAMEVEAPANAVESESESEEAAPAVEDDDDEDYDDPGSPVKGTREAEALKLKLAVTEEKARKEAKKVHERSLQSLRQQQNAAMASSGKRSAEARLKFLAEQTDVFARFMSGNTAAAAEKAKKSRGKKRKAEAAAAAAAAGKGGRTRKTEEEEDEELMATSLKGKVLTRLTVQPQCIKFGKMRPYQIEGLNWLVNLYEQGINGILADEMGLGKTLQTISLLGYLKNDRNVSGPHIVIVPKSVLGNWLKELKRWCPSLRAIKVHGAAADRAEQLKTTMRAGEFDVVVTTYEVVRIERAAFLKFKWRYLIMDEAHSIKNEQSRLAKTVRELDVEFRLLITGTPLQNNLRELWALLNFLLPEVFSDAEMFEDFFKLENMAEESVVSKLHAILRPFMLRRLKTDVEAALPPKREVKLYIGMSEMQTYYYKKTLSKDVAALNQLGGPEKTRLLNILMQLRKVCNHPYLFQGAEPGPPYHDGPHLWESAGKMILLDKLLGRLKQQGDRVLIFSQMTRLLDILEDYMRFKQYQYCRLDGSTAGEDRDKYMEEFNAPDSDKFVFLLSTRAGGLGINLQTANVVVLYDSDWNPQADLQAQDRAHRIGQKKEVVVYRFVTEGTVEEKIVERAEKKLYLDAVVVQQGRLQQQNKNLNKGELMAMVKFGAEGIFSTSGATVTDADIDLILEKGKKKTEEAKAKYKTDAQHSLLNFRLDEGKKSDTFLFEGEDYRQKQVGNFIALPQRERKKNYAISDAYKSGGSGAGDVAKKKEVRKGLTMHDYQFYQKEKIEALEKKEHELASMRRTHVQRIKDAKANERRAAQGQGQTAEELAAAGAGAGGADGAGAGAGAGADGKPLSEQLEDELAGMGLSDEEVAEKERLVEEGFQWNRRDLRAYTQACERHGRSAKEDIVADVAEATDKPRKEILEYHTTFWKRYHEIAEHERIIDKIKKGEQKLARRAAITEALDKKIARTTNPWQALAINYGSNKGKTFTEEEDRFLVCMMQRLGYGAFDQLKAEIRKAYNFRFDWFLKSRTSAELQRRCDTLVRLIEKEEDDNAKKAKAANTTSATLAAAAAVAKKTAATASAAAGTAAAAVAVDGDDKASANKRRRKK